MNEVNHVYVCGYYNNCDYGHEIIAVCKTEQDAIVNCLNYLKLIPLKIKGTKLENVDLHSLQFQNSLTFYNYLRDNIHMFAKLDGWEIYIRDVVVT